MSAEEIKSVVKSKNLKHIAFIMDGNGRWAKKRGLTREQGHVEGARVFKSMTEYCLDLGIEYMTVYAFSTENWKRSKTEVSALLTLFSKYMEEAFEGLKNHHVKIQFLGEKSAFPKKLKNRMEQLEEESKDGFPVLNVALNYGSRAEILRAVNLLLKEADKTEVSEAEFSDLLYTKGCPDPDLIVRTAGEQRLSNFLLWQAAYSEFYYTDVLWPDLTKEEIDRAILSFGNRTRRYGSV